MSSTQILLLKRFISKRLLYCNLPWQSWQLIDHNLQKALFSKTLWQSGRNTLITTAHCNSLLLIFQFICSVVFASAFLKCFYSQKTKRCFTKTVTIEFTAHCDNGKVKDVFKRSALYKLSQGFLSSSLKNMIYSYETLGTQYSLNELQG